MRACDNGDHGHGAVKSELRQGMPYGNILHDAMRSWRSKKTDGLHSPSFLTSMNFSILDGYDKDMIIVRPECGWMSAESHSHHDMA